MCTGVFACRTCEGATESGHVFLRCQECSSWCSCKLMYVNWDIAKNHLFYSVTVLLGYQGVSDSHP